MPPPAVPKLFLIDTFGFIFRAYHARARSGAPPMRTTTGISTEAIFIFHNMLRKLLDDLQAGVHFARSGRVRRRRSGPNRIAEYKANRTEMPRRFGSPDPLRSQAARSLADSHSRIPGFRSGRRHRHDRAPAPRKRGDVDVVIVSSDKDMLQLVTDRVSMLNPMKDDTCVRPGKNGRVHGRAARRR